ncbi:MAG: PaaI family thioesterase [Kiloniellaceae bacterium]
MSAPAPHAMSAFAPKVPDFAARVRASFARQNIMDLIGARLTRVEPGLVEIELPFRDDLTQQHGFFHAGVTGAIADSAGGYAGFTLFPAGASVLTVEYKMNLLAPADGELLRAVGRVLKPGRTLTVCDVEVFAEKDGTERLCAKMLQSLIALHGRPDDRAG